MLSITYKHFLLRVIMQNVVILSVIMLSVFMLSVVAPSAYPSWKMKVILKNFLDQTQPSLFIK
jgi:hypothetical protein